MKLYGTALDGLSYRFAYPPGNVTEFRTWAEGSMIKMSWCDPEDTWVDNAMLSKWVGTKIVRKEGSYPAHENDGYRVGFNTTRNAYQATEYIDTNVRTGSVYYYQAFPYSSDSVYNCNPVNRSAPVTTQATFTLRDLPIGSSIRIPTTNVLPNPFELSCFTILKHGYPDERFDRTLLFGGAMREYGVWNASGINAYANSTVDKWLNEFYFTCVLDESVQPLVEEVPIPYTPGNGDTTVSTLNRKVFLLSGTEAGYVNSYINIEGIALLNFDRLILDSIGVVSEYFPWWTRSPLISDKGSVFLGGDCRFSSSAHEELLVRPAFTLPSSTEIDYATKTIKL